MIPDNGSLTQHVNRFLYLVTSAKPHTIETDIKMVYWQCDDPLHAVGQCSLIFKKYIFFQDH